MRERKEKEEVGEGGRAEGRKETPRSSEPGARLCSLARKARLHLNVD